MQVLVARIQALELADQQIAPFLVEMNPHEVVLSESYGYSCRH
jgi:hypothetical protein